jgi:hypothetical protein
MIQIMTFQDNVSQNSIGEAINPGPIMGEAIKPGPIAGKAINRGSIVLEQSNKSKSYCGKAINLYFNLGVRTNYFSLPNKRLKLTAPAVHASCLAVASILAGGKKRAPRPAA